MVSEVKEVIQHNYIEELKQKEEMAHTETIRQAIAQAAVEGAETAILAINGESTRQSIHMEQNGASKATRHKTDPSLK